MNLRRLILETLATSGDHRWGRGRDYLLPELQKRSSEALTSRQVMEALWGLLAEGLVFVDYQQSASENWVWVLTERGRRVVEAGDDYEPDDPEGYLDRLQSRIAGVDELVLLYSREALRAYNASCYLASSVMLGVASERAFQLLGEAFASWVPEAEGKRFRQTFDSPRQHYLAKFSEFRRRVESRKPDLPPELADNMALTLDSVADLLRVNRNEAGHPTGRRVDRGEAYINLQMFARYLKKLYAFREFFGRVQKSNAG